MLIPLRKNDMVLKIINMSLIDLPAPINLSFLWNYGSLLSLCLMMQILTGLMVAMHFSGQIDMAFISVIHTTRDVFYGWMMRFLHANGASFFFICIYIHVSRGLYYGSYNLHRTWNIGVMLLIMVMATSFLGYVLPWGQMSFWGATVITNLLSAIPYLGLTIVEWLWGGFSIDNATLTRFFSFHFILPFAVLGFVIIHLYFLHSDGSLNPLGLMSDYEKISFHPYYSVKDLLGVIILMIFFIYIVLLMPNIFGDVDNFIPANPLVTPVHIQPEWYFLFAYAILRSIPNKLGGVIFLLMSLGVLFLIPFMFSGNFQGFSFYPISQLIFWFLVVVVLLLTWIGARSVEVPFILLGQLFTIFYFFVYFFMLFLMKIWSYII